MEWWQAYSVLGWHRPDAYWEAVEDLAEKQAEEKTGASGKPGLRSKPTGLDLIRQSHSLNAERIAAAREAKKREQPSSPPPEASGSRGPPAGVISDPAVLMEQMRKR